MISLQDQPGGGSQQDPAPKHTVQKSSIPDTSNKFFVGANGDVVSFQPYPDGPRRCVCSKEYAINLAAWLVALVHGEKEFWLTVDKISQFPATTAEGHKLRHEQLHRSLDELLADWIGHTKSLPSKCTVAELIQWSHEQTVSPTKP